MINKSRAKGLQHALALHAWDCYNPLSYISGLGVEGLVGDVEFDRSCWQAAVDTVYRFVVCGLIELPWKKQDDILNVENYSGFFDILKSSPPDGDFQVEWFDELCPTELCKNLIDKYDLTDRLGFPDYDVCEPFINELESLFELHGVPWSDEPLLPILPVPPSDSNNF